MESGVRFSPRTSATSVSPCGRTSQTPAGTSNHAAHWSCPCRKHVKCHRSCQFVHSFQKCWRTSACPRSGGRCLGLCVWRPESSSSSLSRSLSYPLSSGQPNLTNMEDRFTIRQLSNVLCQVCVHPSPLTCQHVILKDKWAWCVSSLRPGWNKTCWVSANATRCLWRSTDISGKSWWWIICVVHLVCALTLWRWLL